MSDNMIQLNEDLIKHDLKALIHSSVEETLIEMYLAGVSVRRVEDITEALWGTKVSPGTISNLNKKTYEHIEAWRSFFVWLKERGLTGVRLIIGDKNLGMLETIPEVFPDARYQRCTVHFYRNIFSVTPRNKMKAVAMMLKGHPCPGKQGSSTRESPTGC